MEVSAFYIFLWGFLYLKGIQEVEASGLLLQVTLSLLPRKISAFYELVALPYWTPKHQVQENLEQDNLVLPSKHTFEKNMFTASFASSISYRL